VFVLVHFSACVILLVFVITINIIYTNIIKYIFRSQHEILNCEMRAIFKNVQYVIEQVFR